MTDDPHIRKCANLTSIVLSVTDATVTQSSEPFTNWEVARSLVSAVANFIAATAPREQWESLIGLAVADLNRYMAPEAQDILAHSLATYRLWVEQQHALAEKRDHTSH